MANWLQTSWGSIPIVTRATEDLAENLLYKLNHVSLLFHGNALLPHSVNLAWNLKDIKKIHIALHAKPSSYKKQQKRGLTENNKRW